jgi:serine/threonine-protein kinase HipA
MRQPERPAAASETAPSYPPDAGVLDLGLFVYPGGGFRVTPHYDVLTAQPTLDGGQIRRKPMKLAMAVGNQRRYRVDEIALIQSAGAGGLGEDTVRALFAELVERTPDAIDRVMSEWPVDFPTGVCASIIARFEARLAQLTPLT